MLKITDKACAAILTLGLGLAPSGCLLFAGDDDSTSGSAGPSGAGDDDDFGEDDVPAQTYEALRACRGDLTDAEVADNIRITDEYAQSLHEMVACGGLNVALCLGVTSGIVNAIWNGSNDATPDGWRFQGEGVYITDNMGVEMTTQFYLAEDFETLGKAGDPVQDNLFLVDSYLVDPVVAIDFSTGATELRFDAAGPLVELLGFGPDPQSPIPLSVNDLDTLDDKLEDLVFDSIVVVDDYRTASTIQYHTVTERMPARALLGGTSLEFELVEASGLREDLDQDLLVDEWTIQFAEGRNLNGKSVYRVLGGLFDFQGVAQFNDSSYAETTLDCL